jgi:hypothetical protein
MRRRTAAIDDCIDCPFCDGFEPAGDGARSAVLCRFQSPESAPSERPVGTVLARFTTCVRIDAIRGASIDPPLGGLLAVVDADLRIVGVLEPGPHVRVDDRGRALAIEEGASLSTALTHLARQRRRHAPVVSRDGTVVGSVEDVTALRALRVVAEH